MLDGVLLQRRQVDEALAAPHALELRLARVHALVLGEVLALLEALVAVGTLERLLPGVNPAVALQLRGVPETFLAVGALQRLLPRRVAAVLHELGRRHEALVAQRALQRLLCAVRVLVALQRGILFVAFTAHVALVGLLHLAAAFVPQQLPRLAEGLLAGRTLEEALHPVDLLVVQQVGRLEETLIAQVALEGSISCVFVSAAVAHESVLLLEAHLALLALEGPLLGVGAFVLPQIRRALEALPAGAAAERPLALRLALVVQELGGLLKVHLAQVALEEVLARVSVHVPHQVRAVLEALLAHGALVRPLGAVRALVVRQVRRLAETFIAGVTFVRLLARVHSFVARQLGQMTEGFVAHRALVGPVRCRGLIRRRGGGPDRCPAAGRFPGGGLLGVGSCRGWGDVPRTWPVRFLADGTLHRVVPVAVRVVMLGQGGEQRKAHLTNAAHERLLLHLHTLMLQEVGGLAEDLHALRALEGPVLVHHALVLVRVGQVRDVVAAGAALVPPFTADLHGGLLSLDGELLAVLRLLHGRVRLQDDAVHSTAQGVISSRGECVHNGGWSHCMLLLPRLCHPSTSHARTKQSAKGGGGDYKRKEDV